MAEKSPEKASASKASTKASASKASTKASTSKASTKASTSKASTKASNSKVSEKAAANKRTTKETKKSTQTLTDAKDSKYAIVESSGQQFWVQPNRYYDLDRIQANVDDTVTLENVLLLKNGKEATIGKPYVKGATVELQVLSHRRGPKILVYKMRPKKKTRRKNGHRQELTRVMVKSISISGKAIQ